MNKKTIATVLMTSVLCIAGCNNNKPADTTSVAATTTTTAATTEAITTETITSETTTDVTVETETPDTTDDIAPDANPSENSGEPLGETILETDVPASFQAIYDQLSNVMGDGLYTMIMSSAIDYMGQEMQMSATVASSPDYGVYSDTNAIFMTMKNIMKPDGTMLIIDDAEKYYVNTTSDESGVTITTNNSAVLPVKEDITTADIIQFSTGNKAYRFTITPENNASDTTYSSNVYIYADETTGYPVAIYTNENEQPTKMWLEISDTANPALFEIPADYTEITYAEYQQKIMESFNWDDDETKNVDTE